MHRRVLVIVAATGALVGWMVVIVIMMLVVVMVMVMIVVRVIMIVIVVVMVFPAHKNIGLSWRWTRLAERVNPRFAIEQQAQFPRLAVGAVGQKEFVLRVGHHSLQRDGLTLAHEQVGVVLIIRQLVLEIIGVAFDLSLIHI